MTVTLADEVDVSRGDMLVRPEIRLFATWMNWSKALDNYALNDDFGSAGFTAGGSWNFGVQAEVWF